MRNLKLEFIDTHNCFLHADSFQNKEVIKEKTKNHYKNLSEEEKNKIKEYQKKRYQELIQYKK